MACYFPIKAYRRRDYSLDSNVRLVFAQRDANLPGILFLPCGRCIGCRLERSRQWAVRCMHEASLYDKNSFLTLTYNDENLPSDGSLHLDHFQKFMKRLRRGAKEKIRFFHCGEYGDKFGRPHYHALLFNYDFPDKRLFGERNGHKLFTSDSLSFLWNKGFSIIGDVTFDSAAYVARYITKKITGDKAELHYNGRKPEYITMSRRPGIGKGWYEKFKTDVYPLDRVIVRGNVTRPPRFYDGLLGSEDPSTLALLKINREKSGQRFVKDVLTDGRVVVESDSSLRRLAVKEEVKKAEISTLRRSLEEVI